MRHSSLDGVLAGEAVAAAVHGVVEQPFVGFLSVPEGGREIHVEVDGLA